MFSPLNFSNTLLCALVTFIQPMFNCSLLHEEVISSISVQSSFFNIPRRDCGFRTVHDRCLIYLAKVQSVVFI